MFESDIFQEFTNVAMHRGAGKANSNLAQPELIYKLQQQMMKVFRKLASPQTRKHAYSDVWSNVAGSYLLN